MAEKDTSAGDHVSVDLSDVGGNEWPPEGVHVAKVVKCETQRSSSGNPMLYWEFEVSADDGSQFRRVWTNTSLQPQALWKLRDLVNALGVFPGPDGFKKSECLGKMCRIWVTHEEYQGKTIAKVDEYSPLG